MFVVIIAWCTKIHNLLTMVVNNVYKVHADYQPTTAHGASVHCSSFTWLLLQLDHCKMGVLSALTRGLVRGADRMAEFTSKRGPRTFYKSRGARPTGILTSSRKFIPVQAMIPEFVVPNLEGFNLKAYVSYKTPAGTEPPLTPEMLFNQVVAPQIKRDIEEGVFDEENLEKYGLEKTQNGKLFKLHPRNFVR
ncbi:39S ribosomal protein L41, mitochondrial isoform X1 [Puntigrus tetrazona]|uniref:39S ribosomal protein L41, mitochondrial isoform X1 n=2 Tax=Puntigrus tetrazona TaxID=1606681 RepID=UPI001C8A61A2|nr:39S ribosomal protein L41, mitochondrial isoform X1 [Puntigrus tetrazona]